VPNVKSRCNQLKLGHPPIEGQVVTIFELRVDPSDTAKIIGRQGRTVDAMRGILNAIGAKLRRRFVLEILE
jgi:hypothetical protein